MDNFANNDPSGRLEGHFHDPQTGQKRPADQADSSSSPNGNWGSFKHIKQEHSSEGQQVGFSDQISRLGEQSLSHNHHYVSPAITDPSTNYMLYPISNQHHDPFFQYPSHPSEEPQYTSTIQTNELTSGQVFSELHDLQSSNITTMPAQTYALQNEHYEYQKETSSRVDDREARFRDENEYKRVCSENEKLRKDLETLQHQCQKLCDENAVLQSSKPQSTPDEEEIIRHWEILKHAINNLATQKFHGYPLKRATKENQDLFKPLTPNFDHYLMKGPKALLIEAAIWRMLVDNFLHSPSLVYQTAAGDSIRAVEQANRRNSPASREVTVPLYYTWRALTGQLLHMVYGDNGAYGSGGRLQHELANEMVRLFGRYSSYVDTNDLKLHFIGIIEKAVDVARLMARSESRYVCCPADKAQGLHGMELDENLMQIESENPSGDGKVELIVSPALLKTTLLPENIKQKRKVLFKAGVCW